MLLVVSCSNVKLLGNQVLGYLKYSFSLDHSFRLIFVSDGNKSFHSSNTFLDRKYFYEIKINTSVFDLNTFKTEKNSPFQL